MNENIAKAFGLTEHELGKSYNHTWGHDDSRPLGQIELDLSEGELVGVSLIPNKHGWRWYRFLRGQRFGYKVISRNGRNKLVLLKGSSRISGDASRTE